MKIVTSPEYCTCSALSGTGIGPNKDMVNFAQCVIDNEGRRFLNFPCPYMITPEKMWYDEKKHTLQIYLRGILWMFLHPFYSYRYRDGRVLPGKKRRRSL